MLANISIVEGEKSDPLRAVLLALRGETDVLFDHLWVNHTKGFVAAEGDGFKPGDIIWFDARVTEYEKKDYYGWWSKTVEQGFRLSFPTKVEVVSRECPSYVLDKVDRLRNRYSEGWDYF